MEEKFVFLCKCSYVCASLRGDVYVDWYYIQVSLRPGVMNVRYVLPEVCMRSSS